MFDTPWWRRSKPDEIPSLPWLHPAVILYLDKIIQPDWVALEHGSGGSTVWLSERVKHLTSFEHDEKWLTTIAGYNLPNVDLKLDRPEAVDLEEESFDLIFIDGKREHRAEWAMMSLELIKPGGVIVFDNFNRLDFNYPVAHDYLKRNSKHYIEFQVNAPGHKHAVTAFYRARGGVMWI